MVTKEVGFAGSSRCAPVTLVVKGPSLRRISHYYYYYCRISFHYTSSNRMRSLFTLVLVCIGASALHFEKYKRMPPGFLQREYAAQHAPAIPFKNFSQAYVKKALSQPINWTALGAVTPVKDQGEHGYCGTFGRVGTCEGQVALKKGVLVSLAEEELIDCIGWDQDQVRWSPCRKTPLLLWYFQPLTSVFILRPQRLHADGVYTLTTRLAQTWIRLSRGTHAATTSL